MARNYFYGPQILLEVFHKAFSLAQSAAIAGGLNYDISDSVKFAGSIVGSPLHWGPAAALETFELALNFSKENFGARGLGLDLNEAVKVGESYVAEFYGAEQLANAKKNQASFMKRTLKVICGLRIADLF